MERRTSEQKQVIVKIMFSKEGSTTCKESPRTRVDKSIDLTKAEGPAEDSSPPLFEGSATCSTAEVCIVLSA
jgi:hypothetical protein